MVAADAKRALSLQQADSGQKWGPIFARAREKEHRKGMDGWVWKFLPSYVGWNLLSFLSIFFGCRCCCARGKGCLPNVQRTKETSSESLFPAVGHSQNGCRCGRRRGART